MTFQAWTHERAKDGSGTLDIQNIDIFTFVIKIQACIPAYSCRFHQIIWNLRSLTSTDASDSVHWASQADLDIRGLLRRFEPGVNQEDSRRSNGQYLLPVDGMTWELTELPQGNGVANEAPMSLGDTMTMDCGSYTFLNCPVPEKDT